MKGNYLRLLGNDLTTTVLDKVADLYEEDILHIERKINKIKTKWVFIIITKDYIDYGSVFMDSHQ